MVQQATVFEHVLKPSGDIQSYREGDAFRGVGHCELRCAVHLGDCVGNLKGITLIDAVVIRFVDKHQRENARIDQVGHVDAGK